MDETARGACRRENQPALMRWLEVPRQRSADYGGGSHQLASGLTPTVFMTGARNTFGDTGSEIQNQLTLSDLSSEPQSETHNLPSAH